jgi:outer membrane protein assembly factor BamB
MTRFIIAACFVTVAASTFADIIGWRAHRGLYPDANAVTEWADDKNVIWKTGLPGQSNATPIIVGDRIFVCSEPTTLVCLSMKDGSILWEKSNDYSSDAGINAGINADGMPLAHGTNGYSSPTPVTDGTFVYVLFATGVAACYDMDGARQWAKLVEKPNHKWGHSASPILVNDTLIVHVLDVIGLDLVSGAEKWRTPAEHAWGSPVATRIGATDVIITARRGDIIRASDGKKLLENSGGLQYATPVIVDDIVYYVEGIARAVRLKAVGDAVESANLWTTKIRGSRHYGSVVVDNGLIYASSREGSFAALDAVTGDVLYETKLNISGATNSVYSSIVLAGKHIHVGSEEGVTVVIEPGRAFAEVTRNTIEGFRSTPVFVDDRMYVRTFGNLYCIGK